MQRRQHHHDSDGGRHGIKPPKAPNDGPDENDGKSHNHAITISTPLARNAPTAACKPPSGIAEDASNAPPGVDHAMLIGSRYYRLSRIAQTPIPIDNAINPNADCAGEAPTDLNP
jgi:hypothetical protein